MVKAQATLATGQGYRGRVIRDERVALYELSGAGGTRSPDTEVALDLETSGLSPFSDKIAVVTLMGQVSNVPIVLHTRGNLSPDLKAYLGKEGKRFTGHNLTCFDALFLESAGVPFSDVPFYDTLVGECTVIQTGRRDVKVSLAAATKRRLGKTTKRAHEDHSSWMNPVLSEDDVNYCAGDILQLHPLREKQIERAIEKDVLRAVEFEMELAQVVVKMSKNGLPFNHEFFYDYQSRQTQIIDERKLQLTALFGKEINLASPKQVLAALASVGLELDSTAAEVLGDVVRLGGDGSKPAGLLLDHRHASQRQKMYTDTWIGKYVADGWLHSRFWQVGTDTGRFSSSDPNLQQIPTDGRPMIGGLEGYKIVSADYSAIEVRVAAHLSGDQALIDGFSSGEDMHKYVGGLMFGKPPSEITKDERQLAKAAQFCLLFAGGPKGFQRYAKMSGVNIDIDQAKLIVRQFMQRFEGVARMRDRAYALQERGGAVTLRLPTGLRRVLIGRECVATRILNTTVQGTAAAGIKYAIMECHKRGLSSRLGSVVHDELVAAVPAAQAVDYGRELSSAMEDAMKRVISVPAPVVPTVSDHWSK